ncbi:uncharacterized protein [Halyomorpha halys]|uniref:uncharacterized protein n=1 Tax=Halyomorpha halys TaxID=286706 RepID=UPI0006D4F887|nr:uncharacterized protein LOC106689763 [Halyomorpha halys]XP_024216569.1 uncharacterized protein LOC106689763 [Halyomorpha halys]
MSLLPRFRKAFCGCSLEAASLFIAWWSLIGITLQLVAESCIYVTFKEEIEKKINEEYPDNKEFLMLWMHILFSLAFGLLSISLLFATMLVIGIYKRNHRLILPWLIMSGIGLFISLILGALSIISSMADLEWFLISAVSNMLTVFGVYCYLIVYSFYCEIQDERGLLNNDHFRPLY